MISPPSPATSPPPVAAFTVTSPVYVNQEVQYVDQSFDPAPGHVIVLQIWIGREPSFPSPGTYAVTLDVEDDRGLWGMVTHDVSVVRAYSPPPPRGGGGGSHGPQAGLTCVPCTVMRGDPVRLILRLTRPSSASQVSLHLPADFRARVTLPSGTIDYATVNAARWNTSRGSLSTTIWVPWTATLPANGSYRIAVTFTYGGTPYRVQCTLTVLGTDRVLVWR